MPSNLSKCEHLIVTNNFHLTITMQAALLTSAKILEMLESLYITNNFRLSKRIAE